MSFAVITQQQGNVSRRRVSLRRGEARWAVGRWVVPAGLRARAPRYAVAHWRAFRHALQWPFGGNVFIAVTQLSIDARSTHQL